MHQLAHSTAFKGNCFKVTLEFDDFLLSFFLRMMHVRKL